MGIYFLNREMVKNKLANKIIDDFLKEWQARFVLVCSLSVMLYFQLFCPFYHPGGDSAGDFFLARYILHLPGGIYITYHTPGKALFLILSGVLSFDTWKIMIGIYALMSMLIPVMIYLTIKPYNKTWAFIVAMISVISLIPFAYSRVDTPDHLFLFFEVLIIFLVATYFYDPVKYRKFPYFIAMAAYGLNMVKPIAVFLFWIYLFCALFLPLGNRKVLLKSMLFYLSLMGVWVILDRNIGNGNYPEWSAPETTQQRRFAETYYQPNHFLFANSLTGNSVISDKDGSASRELRNIVRHYVNNNFDAWSKDIHSATPQYNYPYELFGVYSIEPESLVNSIFNKPNAFYFNFIRMIVQQRLGSESDSLFYRVAKEHGNTGIYGGARYLIEHPMKLISGPAVSMGWRNLLMVYYLSSLREQLSWNILVANNSVRKPLLNSTLGPYSHEYFSAINFFVNGLPDFWEHSNWIFERFSGHPQELYQAILNPEIFELNEAGIPYATIVEGWYYTLFMCIYGAGASNELFAHVVFETIQKHPKTFLFFVDNFIHEITSLGMTDPYMNNWHIRLKVNTSDPNYFSRVNEFSHLTSNLAKELLPQIIADKHSKSIATIYIIMHCILPIISIIGLLLFPFALRGVSRYLAFFLLISYLHFITIFSIFGNFGDWRYSNVFLLLGMMLTGLCFSNLTFMSNVIYEFFSLGSKKLDM